MQNEKLINVVFDTRSIDFENGTQYQSLIDQMNAVLQSGQVCRNIEITQWCMYHTDGWEKGEENIHVPFHRHFYHNREQNTYGGGFMLFEVLEDLSRYYKSDSTTDELTGNIELVFTVTVTVV